MNVRQGDLAFVVRGLDGPASIHVGKIVRVLSFFGTAAKLGPIWNVELQRPVALVAARRDGTVISPIDGAHCRCQCPDSWLRPIRGEEVDGEPHEVDVSPSTEREAVPA